MNLSRVSLGTMLFGSLLDQKNSFSLLDEFYKLGGRVIDTAQMYPVPCKEKNIGITEKIIGEWLSKNNLKSEFFISSKISGKSDRLPFLCNGYSDIYGREHLREQVLLTLERLQLNQLDLLYLHWPIRKTHNFGKGVSSDPNFIYDKKFDSHSINSYIENIFQLYNEGLIKNIGVSNETPYGILKFLQTMRNFRYNGKLFLQNPINLLSPGFVLSLQEICFREKICVQAHSPLAFGSLSEYKINQIKGNYKFDKLSRSFVYKDYFTRYNSERSNHFLIELDKITSKKDINIYDLAYGFLLNDPTISHIVIGPRTISQLRKSIKSIQEFEQKIHLFSKDLYQLIEKYSILSY